MPVGDFHGHVLRRSGRTSAGPRLYLLQSRTCGGGAGSLCVGPAPRLALPPSLESGSARFTRREFAGESCAGGRLRAGRKLLLSGALCRRGTCLWAGPLGGEHSLLPAGTPFFPREVSARDR